MQRLIEIALPNAVTMAVKKRDEIPRALLLTTPHVSDAIRARMQIAIDQLFDTPLARSVKTCRYQVHVMYCRGKDHAEAISVRPGIARQMTYLRGRDPAGTFIARVSYEYAVREDAVVGNVDLFVVPSRDTLPPLCEPDSSFRPSSPASVQSSSSSA